MPSSNFCSNSPTTLGILSGNTGWINRKDLTEDPTNVHLERNAAKWNRSHCIKTIINYKGILYNIYKKDLYQFSTLWGLNLMLWKTWTLPIKINTSYHAITAEIMSVYYMEVLCQKSMAGETFWCICSSFVHRPDVCWLLDKVQWLMVLHSKQRMLRVCDEDNRPSGVLHISERK